MNVEETIQILQRDISELKTRVAELERGVGGTEYLNEPTLQDRVEELEEHVGGTSTFLERDRRRKENAYYRS